MAIFGSRKIVQTRLDGSQLPVLLRNSLFPPQKPIPGVSPQVQMVTSGSRNLKEIGSDELLPVVLLQNFLFLLLKVIPRVLLLVPIVISGSRNLLGTRLD